VVFAMAVELERSLPVAELGVARVSVAITDVIVRVTIIGVGFAKAEPATSDGELAPPSANPLSDSAESRRALSGSVTAE
jgi:hypothetical protein